MPAIAESHIEEATLAWLGELGFAAKAGPDIGPRLFARQTRAHLNLEVKDLRSPEAARLGASWSSKFRCAFLSHAMNMVLDGTRARSRGESLLVLVLRDGRRAVSLRSSASITFASRNASLAMEPRASGMTAWVGS